MDVHIEEIVSTLHAVDDDALGSPTTARRLACMMLQVVEADRRLRARLDAERRMGPGAPDGREAV